MSKDRDDDDWTKEKLEEKSKIVQATAATLYKFEAITRRLENWRDDRAKLQSNIWRLKLALSVVGNGDKPTTRPLPRIQCQTRPDKQQQKFAAISEIEENAQNHSSWKIEKKRQQDVNIYQLEEPYELVKIPEVTLKLLRRKLREFIEGDHSVEMIICKIVNRFTQTVANLSEELISANRDAQEYKAINDKLKIQVERLNSQLQWESNDKSIYRKRVSQLENLSKKLQDFEKLANELNQAKNQIRINENIIENIRGERESYGKRQVAKVKRAKEQINVLRSILQDLKCHRKTLIKEAEDMNENMLMMKQKMRSLIRDKRTAVVDDKLPENTWSELQEEKCKSTNNSLAEFKEIERRLNEANVTMAALKSKLDEVMKERNEMKEEITDLTYKNEILSQRLNLEETTNSEMMREYQRINLESKVLQDDMKKLSNENETLKRRFEEAKEKLLHAVRGQKEPQVVKKELFGCEISGVDLTTVIEKTKEELEAAKTKSNDLKAQNCQLESSLNILASENVNIEARLQALLAENNELTCRNEKLREENDTFKEQLKQLTNKLATDKENKVKINHEETASTIETETETSTRNDQQLCVENDALKKATTSLRSGIKTAFMESENTKNKLCAAEKEMQALKAELFKLREEKQMLCCNLASVKMELNDFKLERSVMKNELVSLREAKSNHRLEAFTLQENCKTLKILNIDLENRLSQSLRELEKYKINTNNIEC